MDQEQWQPTYEDAKRAHEIAMIESGDIPALVINEANLRSALARPAMAIYYEGSPISVQVARLIDGVATAHGFRDGNKRTGAQLGITYLLMLGMEIATPSSDDTTLGRNVEMLVSENYPDYTITEFTDWLDVNIVEWVINLEDFPDIDWDFPEGDDQDDG
ncbi:MAG TPA: Fic family protein [Thermomicrobiales bacterium]